MLYYAILHYTTLYYTSAAPDTENRIAENDISVYGFKKIHVYIIYIYIYIYMHVNVYCA